MSLTDADRLRLLGEYRASGLDQVTWCAQHQMNPRTLRSWKRRLCPEGPASEPATEEHEDCVAALRAYQVRLAALESSLDEVRRLVAACRAAADAAPADRVPEAGGMPLVPPADEVSEPPDGGQVETGQAGPEPPAENLPPATAGRSGRSSFWESLGALEAEPVAETPMAAVEAGAVPAEAPAASGGATAPGSPDQPPAVPPLAFPPLTGGFLPLYPV